MEPTTKAKKRIITFMALIVVLGLSLVSIGLLHNETALLEQDVEHTQEEIAKVTQEYEELAQKIKDNKHLSLLSKENIQKWSKGNEAHDKD